MNEAAAYCQYLTRRSIVGLLYRKLFLYPRLCRHMSGRALDVGCGIGDMLAYRPNTVGADVNPFTVEYCRQRGLHATLMMPDVLPFDDACFDSVLCDNVLEHIRSPIPLLKEIRRVLAPRGRLLVGVPGSKGYASDPDHKVHYQESHLMRVVASAGFTGVSIFHTPLRSAWLESNLRQYCVYGLFKSDVTSQSAHEPQPSERQ
jgi:SAM-dependent methyltransferase